MQASKQHGVLHGRTYTTQQQQQLELIKQFSEVADCKINIPKNRSHLYANDELTEREIKKGIPFPVATIKPNMEQ